MAKTAAFVQRYGTKIAPYWKQGYTRQHMKRIDTDNFELSTGRRFYANCGIIGIEESGGVFSIHDGYDGSLGEADHPQRDSDYYDTEWTWQEKLELADHMIDLWKRYSVAVRNRK